MTSTSAGPRRGEGVFLLAGIGAAAVVLLLAFLYALLARSLRQPDRANPE